MSVSCGGVLPYAFKIRVYDRRPSTCAGRAAPRHHHLPRPASPPNHNAAWWRGLPSRSAASLCASRLELRRVHYRPYPAGQLRSCHRCGDALMLRQCLQSRKMKLLPSVRPSMRAASSPPLSSCAGSFQGLPTTRGHGNAPGSSPGGRRSWWRRSRFHDGVEQRSDDATLGDASLWPAAGIAVHAIGWATVIEPAKRKGLAVDLYLRASSA